MPFLNHAQHQMMLKNSWNILAQVYSNFTTFVLTVTRCTMPLQKVVVLQLPWRKISSLLFLLCERQVPSRLSLSRKRREILSVLFLCTSFSCFTFAFRIVMPYRTFFCYANSTQEADEWIKILQWKLVGTLIHKSNY